MQILLQENATLYSETKIYTEIVNGISLFRFNKNTNEKKIDYYI